MDAKYVGTLVEDLFFFSIVTNNFENVPEDKVVDGSNKWINERG